MIKELEHLSYEDRVREFEMFSLEHRSVQSDLVAPSGTLRQLQPQEMWRVTFCKGIFDRTMGMALG